VHAAELAQLEQQLRASDQALHTLREQVFFIFFLAHAAELSAARAAAACASDQVFLTLREQVYSV
jgi:hypothetical protein